MWVRYEFYRMNTSARLFPRYVDAFKVVPWTVFKVRIQFACFLYTQTKDNLRFQRT
jgi:hypothetical protein